MPALLKPSVGQIVLWVEADRLDGLIPLLRRSLCIGIVFDLVIIVNETPIMDLLRETAINELLCCALSLCC